MGMTWLTTACSGQSSSRHYEPFKGQTTPHVKHHYNDKSSQGIHTDMAGFMRAQPSSPAEPLSTGCNRIFKVTAAIDIITFRLPGESSRAVNTSVHLAAGCISRKTTVCGRQAAPPSSTFFWASLSHLWAARAVAPGLMAGNTTYKSTGRELRHTSQLSGIEKLDAAAVIILPQMARDTSLIGMQELADVSQMQETCALL